METPEPTKETETSDAEPLSYPPTDDWDAEHPIGCLCATCIQDHPEWDILYGDGSNHDWDNSD